MILLLHICGAAPAGHNPAVTLNLLAATVYRDLQMAVVVRGMNDGSMLSFNDLAL